MRERLPEWHGPVKRQTQEDKLPPPLFEGGWVRATPKALETLSQEGIEIQELLARHLIGEWGDMSPEEAAENWLAVKEGGEIRSVYQITPEVRMIVTTVQSEDSTYINVAEED